MHNLNNKVDFNSYLKIASKQANFWIPYIHYALTKIAQKVDFGNPNVINLDFRTKSVST